MYLKRVKLRNFKSFAGATEIPFQPGFTGVAGPNGMGKSNISDAILFVLGPTSSKALRAERLTHLFFNGGSSKKAATECEVSLVFDNVDKLLPVDVGRGRGHPVRQARPQRPRRLLLLLLRQRKTHDPDRDRRHPLPRSAERGRLQPRPAGGRQQDRDDGPRPPSGPPGAPRGDQPVPTTSCTARRPSALTSMPTSTASRPSWARSRTTWEPWKASGSQAIQYKEFQQDKRRTEARLARAGHRIAEQELATCKKQVESAHAEIERCWPLKDASWPAATRSSRQSIERRRQGDRRGRGGAAALEVQGGARREEDCVRAPRPEPRAPDGSLRGARDPGRRRSPQAVRSDESARAKLEAQDKDLTSGSTACRARGRGQPQRDPGRDRAVRASPRTAWRPPGNPNSNSRGKQIPSRRPGRSRSSGAR